MRPRDLTLGGTGRPAAAIGSAVRLAGEQGAEVRAVFVVSSEPLDVFRAWLEASVVSDSAPTCVGCIGVGARIDMPNASALVSKSWSIWASEVLSPAGSSTSNTYSASSSSAEEAAARFMSLELPLAGGVV